MVAHLTVGKKKYAEVEGQMKTIATEAAMIRERLTEYIDKDSEAYDRVFSAFKLPKETPDEQVIRTNAIQSATKEAAIVPMRVAEEIGSVMETIIYVAHKGNQNAVTDACVAMMAARTCVLDSIVESHKLKNRQIEIVDIRYGLLLRVRTESENDLDLLQEVLNGIGSAKINNLYDNYYCVFFKTRN